MTAWNDDRTGGDNAADHPRAGHEDAGLANPADAAPGSTATSDDRSDDRVLTPGDYTYEPVESRRPGGAPREYERAEPGGDGRSVGRRDEMAARDTEHRDPARDRQFPIRDYERLTIPQIVDRIPTLSPDELREVQEYERSHRRRKTLLVRLERQIRSSGSAE